MPASPGGEFSIAILNHNAIGGVLLGQTAMTKVVPIFVAAMVLLIRVLLINTFSIAGERMFSVSDQRISQYKPSYRSENEFVPRSEFVISTSRAKAHTCRRFAAALSRAYLSSRWHERAGVYRK